MNRRWRHAERAQLLGRQALFMEPINRFPVVPLPGAGEGELALPYGEAGQVQQICAERGWQYDEIQGNLGLFHKLLIDPPWSRGMGVI